MRLVDLQSVELVFCDSLRAYREARSQGLPIGVPVVTTAPALSRELGVDILLPEVSRLVAIAEDISIKFEDLCLAVRSIIPPEYRELSSIANGVLCRQQGRILKGAYLRENDFNQKICVILDGEGIASSWDILLSRHQKRVDFKYAATSLDSNKKVSKISYIKIIFWRLKALYLQDFWSFILKIYKKCWACFKIVPSLGSIAILRDNDLIDDILFSYLSSGIKVIQVKRPMDNFNVALSLQIIETRDKVGSLLCDFYRQFMPSCAADALVEYAMKEIVDGFKGFFGAMEASKALASELKRNKTRFVLTNMLKYPQDFALKKACNFYEIPMVVFQHGISREISDFPNRVRCVSESAASDIFLCYSQKAQEKCEANPFTIAKTHTIGLPNEYWRMRRYHNRSLFSGFKKYRLLYASTAMYGGDVNILKGGFSDIQICEFELKIMDKLLAQLPYRVCYKSYPYQSRYVDPDLILTRAQQIANIDLIAGDVNLIHFFKKAQMIMTMRSTSTLGWCLMTDLPLVFVDLKYSLPVAPRERDWLAQCVFYFDSESDNLYGQLLAFLRLPMGEINEWNAEKLVRRRWMRDEFFPRGAARTAKRYLDQLVKI